MPVVPNIKKITLVPYSIEDFANITVVYRTCYLYYQAADLLLNHQLKR